MAAPFLSLLVITVSPALREVPGTRKCWIRFGGSVSWVSVLQPLCRAPFGSHPLHLPCHCWPWLAPPAHTVRPWVRMTSTSWESRPAGQLPRALPPAPLAPPGGRGFWEQQRSALKLPGLGLLSSWGLPVTSPDVTPVIAQMGTGRAGGVRTDACTLGLPKSLEQLPGHWLSAVPGTGLGRSAHFPGGKTEPSRQLWKQLCITGSHVLVG
jgi:hypothetical protein